MNEATQSRIPSAEELEAAAAKLKGTDVVIDVTTSDGARHVGRRLDNVTIEPSRGLISGWDPRVNAVRTFRLSRVTRLVAAAPVSAEVAS